MDSNEDFYELRHTLSRNWSSGFLAYFRSYIETDALFHGCRFNAIKFSAFRGNVSCTNNISESLNRVLKEWTNFKETPLDVITLTLYRMQQYYLYEFKRGTCGLGIYTLKDRFSLAKFNSRKWAFCRISSHEEFV